MDWDIEVKLQELEMSVIIYQEHCEYLEKENDELKQQVLFLKQQLGNQLQSTKRLMTPVKNTILASARLVSLLG